MKKERIYNLKKQEKDDRDFKIKSIINPHIKVKLPSLVDLRPLCPPIYDQLALGACTSNAGVAARVMLNGLKVNLSRLFQYYEERNIEGTIKTDSGAQMRDIGKAMVTYGICEESYDPYDITKFTKTPTKQALSNALNYKIKSYYSVTTQDEIKQVLALKQQPVLIGIDVYESFESNTVAKTGIVPLPNIKKEKLLGGHAVISVGFDDVKKAFIMRNSWGKSWGLQGYFYLPYTYFAKGYAYDFWVLQN